MNPTWMFAFSLSLSVRRDLGVLSSLYQHNLIIRISIFVSRDQPQREQRHGPVPCRLGLDWWSRPTGMDAEETRGCLVITEKLLRRHTSWCTICPVNRAVLPVIAES